MLEKAHPLAQAKAPAPAQSGAQTYPQRGRTEDGRLRRSLLGLSLGTSRLFYDILFWGLLVINVFSACYWLASRIAKLLNACHWLRPERDVFFALAGGALLTPGVLRGLRSLIRHR